MRVRGIREIWPDGTPLLGVIHLPPLPGAPGWAGDLDEVVRHAEQGARALADAGFDGIVVENFGDAPFYAERVPPVTVAALTRAVLAASVVTELPLGVNVLRNDASSALSIAAVTGARFIRVNVHTGSMWTDQGLLHGAAADTMRLRSVLGADVAVLADVHVKHAVPPAGSDVATAARDAWQRGLADALIVSGTGTGVEADVADLATVRMSVPDAPLLIGSGLTPDNAGRLLARADGAIVGSTLMRDGRAGGPIDPARARAFVEAARGRATSRPAAPPNQSPATGST